MYCNVRIGECLATVTTLVVSNRKAWTNPSNTGNRLWVPVDVKAERQATGCSDNNNMPLESVADPFTDKHHERFDLQVNQFAALFPGRLEEHQLLCLIVINSDSILCTDYTNAENARKLLQDNDELKSMLQSSLKSKSFREVRKLGARQPSAMIWCFLIQYAQPFYKQNVRQRRNPFQSRIPTVGPSSPLSTTTY